jgi:hypothetical protein
VSALTDRLGVPSDTPLVIVSCDDLGSCHAANLGVYDALRIGAATCASLMVPAPWARHAASLYEGEDLGVHLTLNCEHELYRWGPITHAPSLLSGEGGFPRSIADLWDHADPDEVRRECRAQIDRALAWGIDVTHLTPHLTAITLRPEFFDVYLELAVDYALPIRLPSTVTEEQAGFRFRTLAHDEGVWFPDHFDHDWRAGSRRRVFETLRSLPPGVTEIHVQPVVDAAEVRAFAADAAGWIDDYRLVVDDAAAIKEAVAAAGGRLIGYRALRDAMRAA